MQKLLALSFHELGFTNIVERGVQGADIYVTVTQNQKFTFEVKTKQGLSISLSSDNVDALRDHTNDGYSSIIAVLRLAPLEDWILAEMPINEIPVGEILVESLERYRRKDFEVQLPSVFDKVVQHHFTNINRKHYLIILLALTETVNLFEEVSKIIFIVVTDFYKEVVHKPLRTGLIVSHQTFGDMLRFNPHWHCIILEGGIDEEGSFHHIPIKDTFQLTEVFRRRVMKLFVEKGLLQKSFAMKLLGWKHSGFSVDYAN